MKKIETVDSTPPIQLSIRDVLVMAFTKEVALVTTIAIAVYLRKQVVSWSKRKLFEKHYFSKGNTSAKCRGLLLEMLDVLNCDRVVLLQFHNGEKFLSDVSLIRMTLTHQVAMKQIRDFDEIRGIPLSAISRELEQIKDDQVSWFRRDTVLHPRCQRYLDKVGLFMYGSVLLKNRIGVPIGILGFHFCSPRETPAEHKMGEIMDLKNRLEDVIV